MQSRLSLLRKLGLFGVESLDHPEVPGRAMEVARVLDVLAGEEEFFRGGAVAGASAGRRTTEILWATSPEHFCNEGRTLPIVQHCSRVSRLVLNETFEFSRQPIRPPSFRMNNHAIT